LKDSNTPGFQIIVLLGSIMTAVFFVIFFVLLLKKHVNTKSELFTLIVFDVYGNKTELYGIRTNFKNHDVAQSFAKFYKKAFPLYVFEIISGIDTERQIIIK